MKTLLKNANRLILKTRGRFLSLIAIVALGTAFFIGISAVSSVMAASVKEYDDKMNLKDITIYSNYGFDDNDVAALNKMDSVALAEGAKFTDVLASDNEDNCVTRIHSYSPDAQINKFVLSEGRLPENSHEVLSDKGNTILPGFPLGAQIKLSRPDNDLEDILSVDTVTVVGIIETPLYLSGTREPTTLSNQVMRTFLYIPEEAFVQDFYTEINVLIEDGKSYDEFSEEYRNYAASIKEEITVLAETQKDSRRNKIVDEAMEEYNKGLKEYQDGLAKYHKETTNAAQRLKSAEKEIADGWAKIFEGEAQLEDAQRQLDQARIDYTAQIADGKAQLADGYRQLEEGKQEFAKKEQEYLGIRGQLSTALTELNKPILDRNMKLSALLFCLSEEDRQCVLEALKKIGIDLESITVEMVSNYLNSTYSDEAIAVMNERIQQVIKDSEYIEKIHEDGVSEEDTEEFVEKLKEAAKIEESEMDTETDTDEEELIESEDEDLEEGVEEEENPDESKPEEPVEQEEIPPAPIVTEPVIVEPVVPEQQMEEASQPEVLEDFEQPQEETAEVPVEEEPAPIEMPAENEAEEQIVEQVFLMDEEGTVFTDGASDTTDTGVIEKKHGIETFGELRDAMGDSNYTFSELTRVSFWPPGRINVDTGINIINDEARLLGLSGFIVDQAINSPLSDEIHVDALAAINPQIMELVQQLGLPADATLGQVRTTISSRISEIDSGLASGRAQLSEAEAYLHQMEQQLAEAEEELNRKLTEGQAEIDNGWAEIALNRNKLYNSAHALAAGKAQFEAEKKEAWDKLTDAKEQLDNAKEEIDGLEEAEWTILDRSQHFASESYRQTILQMKAISRVFPVFFIAVAALVCLTTMTRMVNEERGQIGIFRALGFHTGQCSFTYLYYAGLASIIGSLIGSVGGLAVFPSIIYNTWRMLYILPKMKLEIPWDYVFGSLIVFFLLMEAVTAYVLYGDMKEAPAAVLRPKPPKLGTDILLEKITFIWNRLSFSWKVTIRNLMRYKRRFVMTVIGVAGCSALLVTGFGISDSINAILDVQFKDISNTSGYIYLSSDACEPAKRKEVIRKIKQLNDTKEVYSSLTYNGKVLNSAGYDEVAYVEIYKNDEALKKVYNVRERTSQKPLYLKTGEVIVSEKMAENLGLHVGDTIQVESYSGTLKEVPISGIMEMYVYHYVLMDSETYRDLYGNLPSDNTLYPVLKDDVKISPDYISRVAEIDGVESVTFNESVENNFNQMITGINGVVLVLILSSMALAFVVLGNLTNVNISERLREIATLKVLGFRQKEVQNYIYKENNVLVAAGAAVGLPMGMVLHRYVMQEVELTNVMFGRSERAETFVYAFVLTVLFGLLVNFFMRRKLDKILMVESLKSVE